MALVQLDLQLVLKILILMIILNFYSLIAPEKDSDGGVTGTNTDPYLFLDAGGVELILIVGW